MNKYDLIGDIHGHANDLIALLEKLGYTSEGDVYRHSERKVIFLGDFIDRGINQKAVLDIVMPMVQEGHALAVMGNHEFNALAFHTPDPKEEGTWLRPRHDKNINQHLAFLSDYASPKQEDELSKVLDFFYTLPLFLEVDGIRVVHACWHQPSITFLREQLNSDDTLTPELLEISSSRGSDEYAAVETVLKGVERKLPDGMFFHDKDGTKREEVRIRWWLNHAETLGELAFGKFDDLVNAYEVTPEQLMGYPETEACVFIGHYWMAGEPQPQASNIACLDYSVAKGGKLVAYQWDGESVIDENKFVY